MSQSLRPSSGQAFTERVYAVVKAIPAGSVLTYAQVATAAGSPHAARAVGQVMKRNQYSFLTTSPDHAIPCHRVVASGHQLGGFNGGTAAKERLLATEGWQITTRGTVERYAQANA